MDVADRSAQVFTRATTVSFAHVVYIECQSHVWGSGVLNGARASTKQEPVETRYIVLNLQAKRVVSYMCTAVNTLDP